VNWDIDYATAFLINHLTIMANEAAKLLSNARVDNPQTHNKAHLPSQIRVPFNRVLFAGKLNKHMLMEWSHLGPEVSGRTSATGIELNIDLHFGNALRDQVLASLIHQMIHAYFLTVCSEPPDSDDPRLSHGNHFGKIMYEVRALAERDTQRPFPLRFGHSLKPPHMDPFERLRHRHHRIEELDDDWDDPGFPHHNTRLSRDDFDCTRCSSHVPKIDQMAVDTWYKNNCKQLLPPAEVHIYKNLKFRAHPRADIAGMLGTADFVEVRWGSKCAAIPREHASRYVSFIKNFPSSGVTSVWIPKDTSEDAIKALITFCKEETWEPDTRKVRDDGLKGPPIIREYRRSWPDHICANLRVFKLGRAIEFDALCDEALTRLHTMPFTHSDPIDAMQEAYAAPTAGKDEGIIHPKLREWSRAFLAKHAEPLSPSATALAASNLGKLQDDPNFSGPYRTLFNDGSLFWEDVIHVEAELRDKPPGAPATPTLEDIYQGLSLGPAPSPARLWNFFDTHPSHHRHHDRHHPQDHDHRGVRLHPALEAYGMRRPPHFSPPAYDAAEKRYWSYDYSNHLHAFLDAAAGLWKLVDKRTGAAMPSTTAGDGALMPAPPALVAPAPPPPPAAAAAAAAAAAVPAADPRLWIVDGQVVAPVPRERLRIPPVGAAGAEALRGVTPPLPPVGVRRVRSPVVREGWLPDGTLLREERRVEEEEWYPRERERPWWERGGI